MDPIVRDILIHRLAATSDDLVFALHRQHELADQLAVAQDHVTDLTEQHAAIARHLDVDPANYSLATSDGKRTVSRKTT